MNELNHFGLFFAQSSSPGIFKSVFCFRCNVFVSGFDFIISKWCAITFIAVTLSVD